MFGCIEYVNRVEGRYVYCMCVHVFMLMGGTDRRREGEGGERERETGGSLGGVEWAYFD